MWILQVSDDSSPQNYLRHHLCTERHEAAVMGCIPRSSVRNSTIPSADIQIELECQDVDLECKDVDDWANETNSQRGVQKNDIADGVDLTLTAILEMFPETVEPIGEDQSATICNNEPNSIKINSSCICCLHTHLSLVRILYMMIG
jgi:hypothetical protein